ncbi:hypothetical protein H072_7358 [Dactylellina haptotyla CBS 200.50]|uniref:Uncharacterized protein n=1 Tax=Dactylellina haptotyla (strain CBS 200.50) TaxID=1284197 RepID=S8A7A1_DACHA|nr:hypothetical protein H072_7358 [Dactylellina haptotyla CBS 200.50]
MASQAQSKKSKASWGAKLDELEDEIAKYCQGKTVDQVKDHFNKKPGLNATYDQYSRRVRKSRGRTQLRKEEWVDIYQQIEARNAAGKPESEVRFYGMLIPAQKRSKELSRNVSATDLIFAKEARQRQIQEGVFIPLPGIEVYTPRGDDDVLITDNEVMSSGGDVMILDDDSVIIDVNGPRRQFLRGNVLSLIDLPTSKLDIRLSEAFEKITISSQSSNSSELTTASPPGLIPIRTILFYLLNNKLWADEIHRLLNQLGRLPSQRESVFKIFFKFLLEDSAYMQIVCERLLPILYLRGEEQFIRLIIRSYRDIGLNINLYEILEGCVRKVSYSGYITENNKSFFQKYSEFWNPSPGAAESRYWSKHTKVVINHLLEINAQPRSTFQAQILLFACKAVLNDLDPFMRLWNPQTVSVASMETSSDWISQFRLLPLFTDNADHINTLSAKGFSLGINHMLILAMSKRNLEAISACLRGSPSPSLRDRIDREFDMNVGLSFNNIETLFNDPEIFSEILRAAVEELVEKLGLDKDPSFQHDCLILYSGSIGGYSTDTAIEILRSKYSLPGAGINGLYDALRFFTIGGYLRNEEEYLGFNYPLPKSYDYPREQAQTHRLTQSRIHPLWKFRTQSIQLLGRVKFQNSLRMLKAAFDLGVCPSKTEIWPSIWQYICERKRKDDAQKNEFQLLNAFIDAGADLNEPIDFEYKFQEKISLKDICATAETLGLGDRTPLALAFYLGDPDLFCFILARNPNIDGDLFYKRKQELKRQECLDFLAALESRDEEKIRSLWEARLPIINYDPVDISIVKAAGGVENLADRILRTYEDDSRRNAFWSLVGYIAKLETLDANDEIYQKSLDVIRYLFRHRGKLTAEDAPMEHDSMKDGPDPIIWGCFKEAEYLPTLQTQARAWDYVDNKGQFQAALIDSAARNSEECLKVLVNLGIKIEDAERDGAKPLFHAIEPGKITVISLLISEGADILATHKYYPGLFSEPMFISSLELAIYNRNIDVVNFILEAYQEEPGFYDKALSAAKRFNDIVLQRHIGDWKNGKDGHQIINEMDS